MRKSWIIGAGTMALLLAGSSTICATERIEDPLGDVVGDAPDIAAVTFSQPEGEPRVSLSIEFAAEPPLETDEETYTDLVWIHLDVDPETAQTIQFETEDDEFDYIIGTAAVQLPLFLETGGMLEGFVFDVSPNEGEPWGVYELAGAAIEDGGDAAG